MTWSALIQYSVDTIAAGRKGVNDSVGPEHSLESAKKETVVLVPTPLRKMSIVARSACAGFEPRQQIHLSSCALKVVAPSRD